MPNTVDLCPTIVEMLYCEALILADEARDAFALPVQATVEGAPPMEQDQDLHRIALSCAGLRTNTRIMHALAWLLNQRAFLRGDLSGAHLRRTGRLPPASGTDVADTAAHRPLLPARAVDMADRVQLFYARVQRLDHAWQDRFSAQPTPAVPVAAVRRMHEWLGQAVARA